MRDYQGDHVTISPARYEGLIHDARRQAGSVGSDEARALINGLVAVLELHRPVSGTPDGYLLECGGCDYGAYAESGPEWPCSTVTTMIEKSGYIA